MDEAGKVFEAQHRPGAVEYRSCPLFKTNIALAATFRGRPDSKEAIAKRGRMNSTRSAGNRNPRSRAPAAFSRILPHRVRRKTDRGTGPQRHARGGAVVSSVHGNFIINEGSATAAMCWN
jgi:UDP-N-acetylenolpyruvoylglucosamine reductase